MRVPIYLLCLLVLTQSCGNQPEKEAYDFFLKANASAQQRDDHEAIRLYTEALNKKHDWPDAYYNRGICRTRLGLVDEAQTDLQTAIRLDPTFALARYRLSKLLADNQHWKESLAELTKLPAPYRDSVYVLISFANVNTQLGNYVLALSEYNRALSLTKKGIEKAEILVNRGNLYYSQNREVEAEFDFKQALKLDQNQDFALNNLSLIEANKTRFQEALTLVERAIALRPGQSSYLNNRGYYLLETNRLAEARESIATAIRLDDNNAWGWRNLGVYFLKINQYSNALRELHKAESIDSSVENLYFYLGEANRLNKSLVAACGAYHIGEKLGDAKAVSARKRYCL